MKKMKNFIIGVFLFASTGLFAQKTEECVMDYNLFKGDVKAKKYDTAKPVLEKLMQKCPKLSINIYKYGAMLAKAKKDHTLMKKIYQTRIVNYPEKEIGVAHNEYATYLIRNKIGTPDEVFAILKEAYKYPKEMSVKNVYLYFNTIYKKNKDTNPSFVFDTYDDVMETVVEKKEAYNAKMKPYLDKEEAGTLTDEDTEALKYYKVSTKSLGKLERLLDQKVSEIAKCELLVPLLKKQYETNKTNAKWLSRSVARLSDKDCKDDPLYEQLVRSYAEVSKTANAYVYLALILDNKGNSSEASQMRKKAFELETDPIKKAKMKYVEALEAKKRGQKSKARSLANQALGFNPNLGKAYLLIANLYQKSANSCGTNEFEKRMVYVAALNKAMRAKAVDPSCGAGKFIRYYQKNIPSTSLLFKNNIKAGSTYKIGCWIGETVKVPAY